MADAGLRILEAVKLAADTIVPDHRIPHVHVLPDGCKLKTEQSSRQIPLMGAALVNTVLTNAKLPPRPRHTLYSPRHPFEDRLTAAGASEKAMAVLMGHNHQRPDTATARASLPIVKSG